MSLLHNVLSFFSGLFAPKQSAQALAPVPDGMSIQPRVIFRATSDFLSAVRADLMRPHPFAAERVGFVSVRAAAAAEGLVLLAAGYHPVADEDYVDNPRVGAMMGQEALRKALELALLKGVGIFHVHMHGLTPSLWFSSIDLREQIKFIPDFFTACPKMPHGAIVLNEKTAAGRVWFGPDEIRIIDEFNDVGQRLVVTRAHEDGSMDFYT